MKHKSSRQPTKSVCEKALKKKKVDEDFVKVIPSFNVSFTYLRIHFVVVQCSVVEA
jgi:hypothetical protein